MSIDWLMVIEDNLHKLYKSENDLAKFSNMCNNYDRIDFLISSGEVYLNDTRNFISSVLKASAVANSKESKSNSLSDSLRLKGNQFYAQKQNIKAFKSYTNAILCAPQLDEKSNVCLDIVKLKPCLLAYSNRSAVFYDEKLYDNCLKDINTFEYRLHEAYRISTNEIKPVDQIHEEYLNVIFKLLNRKANCLYHLDKKKSLSETNLIDSIKFKEILNGSAFSLLKQKIDVKIDELNRLLVSLAEKPTAQDTQQVSVILESNASIISSSVEIKFSNTQGRYCIADREICSGQTLFFEDAFCAILLPKFSKSYCQQCLRSLVDESNDCSYFYTNIDCCPVCNHVLYCSYECRVKCERGFHRYECSIMSMLHNLGIAHLAYRACSTTKFEQLLEYARLQKSFGKERKPIDEQELMKIDYRSANDENIYAQVFHLLTHEESTHVDDLFKYASTSIMLTIFYLQCLFINKKCDELISREDLKLIASLMMRHLLQAICNAHAITKVAATDDESSSTVSTATTYDVEQIRYATAIYPRVSLLNHSCEPNVLSSFVKDTSTIVVKSSRKIDKHEQIYNCYGPHYLKMSYMDRQSILIEQYHFKCDCTACFRQSNDFYKRRNKPKSDTFGQPAGLKCTVCKSMQLFVESLHLKCASCNRSCDLNKYIQQTNGICKRMKSALNLASIGELLEEYVQYLWLSDIHKAETSLFDLELNEDVKQIYLNYLKVADAKAKLLCQATLFDDARLVLKSNVNMLTFLYKPTTNSKSDHNAIEIANEMFKLCQVESNCGAYEDAIRSVNKAISIAESVQSAQSHLLNELNQFKKEIESVLKLK
jgi:hypothetical protein